MIQHFGHDECGVYAEVIAGGTIATGDKIEAVNSDLFSSKA